MLSFHGKIRPGKTPDYCELYIVNYVSFALTQYGAHKNGMPIECVDGISQGNKNCIIIL